MMQAAAFLALTAAFALAGWLGWWTVPVLSFVWGLVRPAVPHPIRWAVLAALLAWVFWLLVDTLAGPGLGRIGGRLAGILHLPLPLLVAATLLLPVLLAWSATAIGCRLARVLPARAR